MHDARLMSLGQARQDLTGDVHHLLDRGPPGGDPLAQRSTVHSLHRDEDVALDLTDVINRRQVRVRDGGRRARLAQEATVSLVLPGEARR